MFLDKLGLGAAEDISARMLLTNSRGEIVHDKNGEPGWIEFWGPESELVRRFRREIERQQYIDGEREKRKGAKVPTEADAERKLDELYAMTVDGISVRIKAWRLVSADGEVLDDPATIDAARQLFGHPAYSYLKREAINFLGDPDNFFTKKAAS